MIEKFYIQPHTYEAPPALVIHHKCDDCGKEHIESVELSKEQILYWSHVFNNYMWWQHERTTPR